MKDVEAVTASLSFEDLLQAVNESSRGRWFLDEFQKRLRKTETGDILSAISRIEARIQSMPAAGAAPVELARMREALSAARADIAKLAAPQGLSAEGRLFASLAEMARKALPAEKATADLAPGIVKALQLVDQLDATLNGSAPAEPPARGDKFFKQDEALFEAPAAAPKPALVTVSPAPPEAKAPQPVAAAKAEVDAPAQGAKLVIIKSGVKVEEPAKVAEQAAPATIVREEKPPINAAPKEPAGSAEQPAEAIAKPAIEMPETSKLPTGKIDNPRIVIIRRKPEEMTEVPLAEESKTETAA